MTAGAPTLFGDDRLEADRSPPDRLTRPMREALLLLAIAHGAGVVFVDAKPTAWNRTATGRAVLAVNRSTWSALERRELVAQDPATWAVTVTDRGRDRVAAWTGRAARVR